MKSPYFVIGIAFIAFVVGNAVASVGELSKTCGDPYPWWLPLEILSILAAPFICGFFAGSEGTE